MTRQQAKDYLEWGQDKTRIKFIESNLSTFNASEGGEKSFMLFPKQKEYLRTLASTNNIITVKHRQCGITTVTSAWVTGQLVFANKKCPETVLCIGKDLITAQQLVEKISDFLLQVPRWMWGDEFYSPIEEDPKNKKSIFKTNNTKCIKLFNKCVVHARASGKDCTRGIPAVSILILDEAAFIPEGPDAYAAAAAATASVKNPKIILVSTPNGKDLLYWYTYDQAIQKKNNFSYVEFKWYQDLRYSKNLWWERKNPKTGKEEQIYETVINNSGLIGYNENTKEEFEKKWKEYEKEGWKPRSPWYDNMRKTLNNDAIKIAQELDISFLGSSDTVIPIDVIEEQKNKNVIEITDDWPLRDIITNTKETWIWKDPIPFHRYICAVDGSTGSSEDYSAIQVIDVDAIDENGMPFFEQVLEYNGKANGGEIGKLAKTYAEIYNNALLVVEAIGGYGEAIIMKIQDLGYDNLYYDDPNLKNRTNENANKKLSYADLQKQLPGFRNSGFREKMIENLREMLKNNSFRIRSQRLISELNTFIFKNGRPDHMTGMHDDLIMCLAMGLFVMQYHMLRNEREVNKQKIMISSWVTNNSRNTNLYTHTPQNSVTMVPNKKINPFVHNQNLKTKNHLSGCLLLGGFRPKN